MKVVRINQITRVNGSIKLPNKWRLSNIAFQRVSRYSLKDKILIFYVNNYSTQLHEEESVAQTISLLMMGKRTNFDSEDDTEVFLNEFVDRLGINLIKNNELTKRLASAEAE